MEIIPTVLIMGAGTSMPYGYPSGNQLVQMIYEKHYHNQKWWSIAEECGFERDYVISFYKALINSQQETIDSFLNSRKDFMEIGKLSIAMCIVENEQAEKLVDFETRKQGCYQFLLQHIRDNLQIINQGQLSIITFNYDRSLEHSLYLGFRDSFNFSDQDIRSIFTTIPIIHIYGSLGQLDWEISNGRTYGNSFDAKKIKHLSENIILFNESKSGLPTHNEIMINQKLIFAKQICFLGFGYHQTNMEKLGMKEVFDENVKANIVGTCLGIKPKDRKRISKTWGLNFPNIDADCRTFLENYVEFFE